MVLIWKVYKVKRKSRYEDDIITIWKWLDETITKYTQKTLGGDSALNTSKLAIVFSN